MCLLLPLAILFLSSSMVVAPPSGDGAGSGVLVHTQNNPLRILLMIPAFDFNRSHVNYAAAIYRVLKKKKYHVDFVVPFFVDNDIEFLKQDESLKEIEFYKLQNGSKKVKETEDEKKAREEEEKQVAEKKKKALDAKIKAIKDGLEGSQQPQKEEEETQNALQSPKKAVAEEKAIVIGRRADDPQASATITDRETAADRQLAVDDMIESKFFEGRNYDVGIAEYSHTSQYAFAVFDALNIKHTIVSKNYSPNPQQYADLGLTKAFLEAKLPSVDRTNVGDHKNWQLETDQKFQHLNLAQFNEAKGEPMIRKYFKSASHFLVNSQPELEFDEGKVLAKAKRGSKGKMGKLGKVKMIGGIHLKEEEYGKERARGKQRLDKNEKIAKFIEGKIDGIGGFAGIVLISFGSVVNTKKDRSTMFVQLDAIRAAIRKMPNYFFIWQLTAEDPIINELNEQEANVYSAGWVDLQAILSDSRTKVFMSHCGKNSLFEAVYNGPFITDVVCVPNFGEQFFNAEVAAKHQFATVLDFYCIELDGQKYTLPYHKSSGNTNLAEFSEDFFLLSKEDQYDEFFAINKDKNYKRNKNGDDRMVSVEGNKYEYCFTEEHIIRDLKMAATAQENQKKPGPIDWHKLQIARKNLLRQRKPHQVLIETMEEIEKEIKASKKHKA